MKNKLLKITIIFMFIYIFPVSVFAHPGGTDEFGCHTCRTNCESWGLEYGEYHCHNAKTPIKKTDSSTSKDNDSSEELFYTVLGLGGAGGVGYAVGTASKNKKK